MTYRLYYLPERSREFKDKDGKDKRYWFICVVRDPMYLPEGNWEFIADDVIFTEASRYMEEAVARQGFYAGEEEELAMPPSVATMYLFRSVSQILQDGDCLVTTRSGWSIDPAGKNLPGEDWQYIGTVHTKPDQSYRAMIVAGLRDKGYFFFEDKKLLKAKWRAKWFLFYQEDKDRLFFKNGKPWVMSYHGWTEDPEGKNLPEGPWTFAQPIVVSDFSRFLHCDKDEVAEGIKKRGYHVAWVETDDSRAILGMRMRERKEREARGAEKPQVETVVAGPSPALEATESAAGSPTSMQEAIQDVLARIRK